jgi:signal transduction histidine kinase
MAIHIALALALIETLALAGLLTVWADRLAGARLLVLFLLGVAIWIAGNELPNLFGLGAAPYAMRMLASAALTSSVFVHFCAVFCNVRLDRRLIVAGYLIGAAGMVLSFFKPSTVFVAFADVQYVPVPNWAGWITSVVWGVLALAGIAVLAVALTRARDQQFRQIAAVAASCGWGLFCMLGYGVAALQLPYYPWPLLGLPAYPLILVYGILRYRVLVANVWARRALAWTILLLLGLLIVAATTNLPLQSRWISTVAVVATCLALNGPVRKFAERVVYPGGVVAPEDLLAWRETLQRAESFAALAAAAEDLLMRRVGIKVMVEIAPIAHTASGEPALVCSRDSFGWHTDLRGWQASPPGPRHVAELLGSVLAESAARIEQAQLFVERERERQLQARLAELGSLAASVAHDLRNPLNIIAMAVATASPQMRKDVADQVARISHLTDDLLDYAKPWTLNQVNFDVSDQIRSVTRTMPDVNLGAGLDQAQFLYADPRRIDQALENLLANARTAAGTSAVELDAERFHDALCLYVCDNGPGIPEDLRQRLFEPFASRRPGGTGLGLAIVKRVMNAHGGTAELVERAPWTTCFELRFPLP